MYSQVMSTFILVNVAYIYTHRPLINMLATAILTPSPPAQLRFLRPKSYREAKNSASDTLRSPLQREAGETRRPRTATLKADMEGNLPLPTMREGGKDGSVSSGETGEENATTKMIEDNGKKAMHTRRGVPCRVCSSEHCPLFWELKVSKSFYYC